MIAEVKDDQNRIPRPTEKGGIVRIVATGADGNTYTWYGRGSVKHTRTRQQKPGQKVMEDVEYIELILVPDPSWPQAQLPIKAAPPEGENG